MKYDVDYFINKFEAIPEEKWTTDRYEDRVGRRCAIGHCVEDFHDNATAYALMEIFGRRDLFVTNVNDRLDKKYQQSTPKQRILAALRDIKQGVKK